MFKVFVLGERCSCLQDCFSKLFQVLAVLQNLPCPEPVATVGTEPDAEVCSKKKGKGKTKKKKRQPKKGSGGKKLPGGEVSSKSTGKTFGAYKPGDFNDVYRKFLQREKESGVSHAEANKAWKGSKERSDLLAEMPEAEKKKRRFT